eukprot:CAMPEP_0179421562 /NCGR_PEP_ID=MMETSP0799-20121207/9857_1 /TAXON_ID=46947 /ORGANISM="Geminigera cryophila, Strain CCMP2564" /LENGTH=329 /DNA_ID=CAMNT_0021195427 /DNA_START=384 /DNA_END=1370 /DNA_ORIENTATION=-
MQFIEGAKVRLVHVDIETLCANPMTISMRTQVTNPALVHVKISKPEAYLERDGKKLMKLDSGEPLIVSANSQNSPVALQIRMHAMDEQEAALAFAHIQAENFLSSYQITYSATLNVRVIALPIHYEFKGSMTLDDLMNPQQKDTADDQKKKWKTMFVNASCWVTTFENECCQQDGSLTEIRFLAMQDGTEALNMQSEVVITSPLIRVSVPSISAQLYIHNTTTKVPSAPVMSIFINEADVSESGGQQQSAMRGEISIHSALISSLKDIVSLGNSDDENGEGDLQIIAKMASTEKTNKCLLQRLASKVEIQVDPKSTRSVGNSSREGWSG